MSLKWILAGAGALSLAACGGGGGGDYERTMSEPAMEMVVADEALDSSFNGKTSRSRPTGGAPVPQDNVGDPGAEQYIAYSHNLGLSFPKGGVEPRMAAHTEACRAAGTATCIVINSNVYSQEADFASGNLSLRATPEWIETFLGGIEGETEQAGGEITQRSTRAEDLTRQIIDTGARLEAQKTLRGRLLN